LGVKVWGNPDSRIGRELFDGVYSTLEETAAKITTTFKTQWDVRNDVARTLLTLSSAVLVSSISLSSHITNHKWLLAVCWATLLLAIISAIDTIWFSLGLFSLPATIFNIRSKLQQRMKNFDIEHRDREVDQIINEFVARRISSMDKLDRRAMKPLKVSISMFLIGLLCTGVIGWLQLRS
jgi:hypothetical protein